MQVTPETARAIVTPLYEALNEPGKKDIKALLEHATTPDFLSCGNEGECVGRDAVGDRARRGDWHACSSVART
jgi:hypothetical protein